MTPVQLEVVLHYYYDAAPLKQTHAIKQAEKALQMLDLLDNEKQITSRGRAFVEMLKDTPLPEWRDPRRFADE